MAKDSPSDPETAQKTENVSAHLKRPSNVRQKNVLFPGLRTSGVSGSNGIRVRSPVVLVAEDVVSEHVTVIVRLSRVLRTFKSGGAMSGSSATRAQTGQIGKTGMHVLETVIVPRKRDGVSVMMVGESVMEKIAPPKNAPQTTVIYKTTVTTTTTRATETGKTGLIGTIAPSLAELE